MLLNPFTPSQIATDPRNFFGRDNEFRQIEATLTESSVAIQGIVGIGKSSLAYQTRLRMEGFNSDHSSKSVFIVCHKGVNDIDHIARLFLERLFSVDVANKKVTWKVPWINFAERVSEEVTQNFAQGRHLQTLVRLLEKEHVRTFLNEKDLLILSVDEADKNPKVIASFIRVILTETQGNGINNIRFLLSGVKGYFKEMLNEDEGIIRFIPSPMTLPPLTEDETLDLLQTKFAEIVDDATQKGISISIHPAVIERISKLSGGNPSLIQLLGSRVILNEIENNDGIIDEKDLIGAFNRVCYQDRGEIYNQLFEFLDDSGTFDSFVKIYQKMSYGFPAYIQISVAQRIANKEDLEWLTENNILRKDQRFYFLSDEMLRVRIALDCDLRFGSQKEFEEHLTLLSDMDNIESYVTRDEYD